MFYHSEAKPQSIYTKTSEEKERHFLDEIQKNSHTVDQWSVHRPYSKKVSCSILHTEKELCAFSVWSLQVS